MSEMQNTNTNPDSSSKSREVKGEHPRNKYQKDYRKDYRSNNDFRRNRNSYNTGYRNDNFGKKPYKRNWSNTQQDGKRKKLEVGNRLRECDVGITEFIGDEGFFGVIKERYTDFHVNEIALDGEIAKLTNQDIPTDEIENESEEDLKKMVSDVVREQLQSLKEPNASSIEIDVTDMDKTQRKAIHTIAKRMTNVGSQTIDKDKKKILMLFPNKGTRNTNFNFRMDTRADWKKRGEYCYFILHKVNMDTMDALNQLAMNLRLRPNNFNYAGTKDRRAWTAQWVSLRKVEPADILRAAKNIRGAYVGNFKFDNEPLKLGMLSGNHFKIALRNVSGTDEQIEKTMISLRDHGFINYYGLQRFGTVRAIPTYDIGKALLQGKWNEAIELILKPREGEQDQDLVEARKIYETTKDAGAAYRRIKRCDKIEATLLKGLCESGNNNPQGALDSIPRNARLMYIHAYQSFVWNHMVSKRIKEFGRKPIVGDLVYANSIKCDDNEEEFVCDNEDEPVAENNPGTNEMENRPEKEEGINAQIPDTSTESNTLIKEVTDATECCLKIDEAKEENKTTNDKDQNEDLRNLPPVKVLTEEDLPHYTLADVIMPQVGWKVTYPPYAKPWLDEFLAKDGLTTDLRQKNKKYSLGGAYRKILQIPSSVSWRIMHYKEKYNDLLMSDISEMRQYVAPKDDPEGQYKALILEMSLKSSTYATMALREILKSDTSPQAQAAQSAVCNAEAENTNKSEEPSESENKTQDEDKNVQEVNMTQDDHKNIQEVNMTQDDDKNVQDENMTQNDDKNVQEENMMQDDKNVQEENMTQSDDKNVQEQEAADQMEVSEAI
ncbi:pseudouridylate synthase 7 homolog [Ceratina calcarata]|uniref:Pseudouridylate synthase 7 homolog n=1 Tax=Ceratina calcarata TaxID=156304 RepID=A0AAJ7JI71_9HYME|nr:pseudouridylate synthase 7 homolog [Ceratina calcarata]